MSARLTLTKENVISYIDIFIDIGVRKFMVIQLKDKKEQVTLRLCLLIRLLDDLSGVSLLVNAIVSPLKSIHPN